MSTVVTFNIKDGTNGFGIPFDIITDDFDNGIIINCSDSWHFKPNEELTEEAKKRLLTLGWTEQEKWDIDLNIITSYEFKKDKSLKHKRYRSIYEPFKPSW